jgi:hypothetical protein
MVLRKMLIVWIGVGTACVAGAFVAWFTFSGQGVYEGEVAQARIVVGSNGRAMVSIRLR